MSWQRWIIFGLIAAVGPILGAAVGLFLHPTLADLLGANSATVIVFLLAWAGLIVSAPLAYLSQVGK